MKLYSTGLWILVWILFILALAANDVCHKKGGYLAGYTCIKKEVVLE